MRKFKRLTMTLALLIMAVTGAWAQSAFGVVKFEVPDEWANDNNPVTAADLPGFNAVALDEAKTWTGKPATGYAMLVYAFDGNTINFVNYINGNGGGATTSNTKQQVFALKSLYTFYYTTEITEWPLTSQDGKVWTLDKMPASNIELQVEYEPTKVTMAANDKTMGTVEVSGESKVEWTADTWKGWKSDTYTVDDITVTSIESASVNEWTNEDKYLHSLFFYVSREDNNSTVTISTTGDPFSRIEFTMIDDYAEDNYIENKGWLGNPVITPKENWTFSGNSAVWEGEATKNLTLQSCTTWVSKITFFKAGVPDGVTVNGDGTFTVAKTATVTLTATPAEGYKFLYWEDDQTNTNPVREVTIESGLADMTYTAVFEEITYNVTFADGIEEADKWTATPNTEVKKDTKVDIKYTGSKKVIGVKVEEKKSVAEGKTLAEATVGMLVGSDGKTYAAADKNNLPEGVTAVALVCYVSDGHGLALALADESEKMNWNTAKSTCSGKTPAVTGCTWKLATQDEWNNMINAAGGFSALRDGFSSVGGTNMLSGSDDYYWSSTTTGSDCAWSCTFSTGNWTDDYVDNYTTDYVRACLAF